MSSHTPRADQPNDPGVSLGPAEPAQDEAQQQPLKKIHQLLRGRYHWAILLGGSLAIAGALGGWFYVQPKHQARGQIAIKTYIPRIMYDTEDTGVLPMSDKFIQDQLQLIESDRIISSAMEDDRWQPYSDGLDSQARADFGDKLRADRLRGTDTIRISFTHTNPDAAEAAVQSVVDAFEQIFRERENNKDQHRFEVLEDRRSTLRGQIDSLDDQIRSVADTADTHNADTLRQMYEFQLNKVQQLEQAMRETELALTSAGAELDAKQDQQLSDDERARRWQDLSTQEIAKLDPQMQSLLDEERALERQLDTALIEYGSNHKRVRRIRAQLENVKNEIEEHADYFRSQGPEAIAESSDQANQQMSPRQLRAKRQQLQELYAEANQRLQELSEKRATISDLESERSSLKEQLAQTKDRLERLNLESEAAVSGRLEINNPGQLVPGIVNDGTRKQLAVLGFGAGGGLGVGFVMLLGYRDQRLRTAADLDMFSAPQHMLGLLPNLPEDLADPANATLAAYAVHHIRSMLQLTGQSEQNQTLTITGPAAQTGKTSLTLGLGLSFASSGCRTLLIDCDLHGGGLSRRLQAFIRRRLGRILQWDGLVTAEQLEQALPVAEQQNKRLGQVLLETGAIDETTLAEALDAQETQAVGLLDALAGEPLEHCIAESGLDNLAVLPVGDASATDTSRISPQNLRQLIDRAKTNYDIILLDTGPLPGAVETNVAAGVTDRAVLVLSRGDQRGEAEKALQVLQSIQVPVAGLVFNRAESSDIARSSQSSMLSISRSFGSEAPDSATPTRPTPGTGTGLRTDRFDPLTRAVASAAGAAPGRNGTANGNGSHKPEAEPGAEDEPTGPPRS